VSRRSTDCRCVSCPITTKVVVNLQNIASCTVEDLAQADAALCTKDSEIAALRVQIDELVLARECSRGADGTLPGECSDTEVKRLHGIADQVSSLDVGNCDSVLCLFISRCSELALISSSGAKPCRHQHISRRWSRSSGTARRKRPCCRHSLSAFRVSKLLLKPRWGSRRELALEIRNLTETSPSPDGQAVPSMRRQATPTT
jgi:hypothetical protein